MQTLLKYCVLLAISFALTANAAPQEESIAVAPNTQNVIHPVWQNFEPEFVEQVCPFRISGNYDTEAFRCGYVLLSLIHI